MTILTKYFIIKD